ncbi:pyridoxal kinase-like [Saccoglossus kowalevskii]|uniref:Pyridoxal kinase n=1 Tax=Saccoglossus kowalevskii TaxID=10224 RepID=A0ABM0LWJ8_SACKO|nr:PREDICTED: pyridoxal kinase-like [Saccoglossus kowalevskii]
MSSCEKRVLSIQSHVVSGYVGNKSATFPMQVLGFEVDAINSVQFSNHTGYNVCKGQVLNSTELQTLYSALKENDIDHYSHVLTGFVGSESFLLEVVNVIKELKARNPNMLFVCDPVLGDFGVGYYVPKELTPIYREKLLPLADLITPNQFEAEELTGITIKTEEDAFKAMELMHCSGCKNIVISSTELGKDDTLVLLGSSLTGEKNKRLRLTMHKFDAHFTGTGDLFTALLLVWSHTHPDNLALACEKTIATMQSVLKKTLEVAKKRAGPGNKPTVGQIELRLISCKDDIEHPGNNVKATVMEV